MKNCQTTNDCIAPVQSASFATSGDPESANPQRMAYYNNSVKKGVSGALRVSDKDESTNRRVIPKQSRAKEIVRAVEEAGLMILKKEGPDKLTTARIAELAGVSVGSLYRYFPNKESIIAAIYAAKTEQDLEFVQNIDPWIDELAEMPLIPAVKIVVQCIVARHREHIKLHGDFYLKNHRTFSIGSRMSPTLLNTIFRKIFEHNKDGIVMYDLDMAVFLVARGLSGIIRMALDEQPEYIHDENFVDQLVILTLRYIGVAEKDIGNIPPIETMHDDLPEWISQFLVYKPNKK